MGVKGGSQQEKEPFLNRFALPVFKNCTWSIFTPNQTSAGIIHCPGSCVTR